MNRKPSNKTHPSLAPVPSPVRPNFPLPRTPVVELLILLGFGADPEDAPLPLPFPLICPFPLACMEATTGGLDADKKEVGWAGTEEGTAEVVVEA